MFLLKKIINNKPTDNSNAAKPIKNKPKVIKFKSFCTDPKIVVKVYIIIHKHSEYTKALKKLFKFVKKSIKNNQKKKIKKLSNVNT